MVDVGILGSTILIKLSLSKRGVDGKSIHKMQPLGWHDDLRKDLL